MSLNRFIRENECENLTSSLYRCITKNVYENNQKFRNFLTYPRWLFLLF